MNLSRDLTAFINKTLDQLLPPVLRDIKVINHLIFKIIYEGKADYFLYFNDRIRDLSVKDYDRLYRELERYYFKRMTNIHSKCLPVIIDNIVGETVLDVGCGSGYLIGKIADKYSCTGCDIVVDGSARKKYPHSKFIKARVENLPFGNNTFDTVICTHTLEHILDIKKGIEELRRVAKKKVIIVVPKQRPYKYTFDLHVHYFPYPFSFLNLVGKINRNECKEIGGDLFYQEFL